MGKSRKTTDEILHVVVGAGNVPYFLNAICSLKELGAGDIYAVYNFIDDDDRRAISLQYRELGGLVQFEVRENNPTARTGSLYEANNMALDYARSKYEFVSFVQADMQVMWWDSAIVSRSRALLASLGDQPEVSFYTQLPILGKHPRPYERWSRDEDLSVYRTHGHVDVCLLPIFGAYNSQFIFEGSEKEMSVSRSASAADLILHPFPYIAPIPFPSTLRDRGRRRSEDPEDAVFPILVVRKHFAVDFQATEAHPVSMEQSVGPNQWSCLFPYWPSDTLSGLWFVRRIEFSKLHKQNLFATINSNGQVNKFPRRVFAPGWKVLSLALVSTIVRRLVSKFGGFRSEPDAQSLH